MTVTADRGDGTHVRSTSTLDTPVQVEYYRNGGSILHTVLREMAVHDAEPQVQVGKTTGCAMWCPARERALLLWPDEHDVNVLIEGEADWVEQHVEELGLTGAGWTMPVGTGCTSHQPLNCELPSGESGIDIEMDDEPESTKLFGHGANARPR